MPEKGPEQELTSKVADALEKEGLLKGIKIEDFEIRFASGKMDAYAWKRLYEKITDETESTVEEDKQ